MGVILAGTFQAVLADVPGAGASWTSPVIEMRHETEYGPVAEGTVLDAFVFHEAINFTWLVQVSHDNVTFITQNSAAVAGHAAGGPGTKVNERIAARYVRFRITNTGVGPATNFLVQGTVGNF